MGILESLGLGSAHDEADDRRAMARERERRRAAAGRYLVGLGLSQRYDYMALAVLREDEDEDILSMIRLERVRNRPYPEIAELVRDTMGGLPPETRLLVDASGVGVPVVDQLTTLEVAHTRISINGATVNILPDGTLSVPKRDLIAALVVRFEQRTLKIPRRMRHAATLEREAMAFTMKLSPAGHDSYNVRSGEHDDLLLAVALPVWWQRRQGRVGVWFI